MTRRNSDSQYFMNKGTVIIGNGIAGITAARHLRMGSDQRIQVISAESPYFFSRTALMYVYMGHMKFEHIKPYEDWFWAKNEIELIHARVENVSAKNQTVSLSTGEVIGYDNLVLATGSRTKYFEWKGQEAKGVQGLVTFQDLQELEANTPKPFQKDHSTKQAIIIGAGLIGVEMAEMLHTRAIEVAMLVREDSFWGGVLTKNEADLIGKHIEGHGIKLLFETEMAEVIADAQNRVKAVRTKSGETLDCQLLGIATGVTPNIEFLKDSGLEMDKGICINENLQTNIPNIYAIGDCAQVRDPYPGRKPIEAVWYVGRMMGEALGKSLAGKKTPYLPGPWFNSAKFFDIEYQTYGNVNPKVSEHQAHYFWKAEKGNQFMTIAYHPETNLFQGINTFGIRLRHEYFHNALLRKKKVGEVIGGIKSANFDPELYRNWSRSLISDFKSKTGIEPTKPSFIKKMLLRS